METIVRLSPEQVEHEHGPFRILDLKRDLFECVECGAPLCLPHLTEEMQFCGASVPLPMEV